MFVQGDLLSEPASGEARAAAWGQLGIRKPQKDEHRAGGSGTLIRCLPPWEFIVASLPGAGWVPGEGLEGPGPSGPTLKPLSSGLFSSSHPGPRWPGKRSVRSPRPGSPEHTF